MALRGCVSAGYRVTRGCLPIELTQLRPRAHALATRWLTSPTTASEAASAVPSWAALAATIGTIGVASTSVVLAEDSPGEMTPHDKYISYAKKRGLKARTQYTDRIRADSVKDRITARYEDKIRLHASPSKTFRYFATVSIEGTVYMRPQDFIRSITPGELQPPHLGLDLFDDYFATDAMLGQADYSQPLLQYNENGTLKETLTLISYAEYRFLCTLLTAPDTYLKVAFRLLDRDGSDAIELSEFFSMTEFLGNKTRQRQLAVNTNLWTKAGNTEYSGVLQHSHLLKQLFGTDGTKRVKYEQFREFAMNLQKKVLHIEFLHNRHLRHPDATDNNINELTFCKLFLKQSQLPRALRKEYYERITEAFGDSDERQITFDDVYHFFAVLKDIEMVDLALNATLQMRGSKRLLEDDLEHIAMAVSGEKINPVLSRIIFVMFDLDSESNADGVDTFIKVARNARAHGVTVDSSGSARGFSNLGQGLISLLVSSDKDGDGHMG